MKARVGLIPGIIGEELKKDCMGTLQRLAEIGYKGVEGGTVLHGGVVENRKQREAWGLQAVSLGSKREGLATGLDQLIEDATAAGAEHIILWWAPCDSRDVLLQDAEFYNKIGEKCAANGLKFCYHNHDHEFKNTFDGEYGLDILMANTDPQCVSFELDVGWVTYGGLDPVAYLKEHAGRFPVIHLKDVADVDERGTFTAVGTGVLDVSAVVTAALGTGTNWVVVEQDRVHNLTPMESVTASFLNIKELGLV